jgi:biopolymer transport protein ExbB
MSFSLCATTRPANLVKAKRAFGAVALSLIIGGWTLPAYAQSTPAPAGTEAPAQATGTATGQAAGTAQGDAPAATSAPITLDPQAKPAATPEKSLLNQFLNPTARTDIPHDLSPVGMFMAADWVVKSVMLGLAFASIITWTVWLAKTLELTAARRRVQRVVKIIRHSKSLADALAAGEHRHGPAATMLRAAAHEVKLSEGALDYAENAGVKERVSSTLGRIEAGAGRRMMRGTGALATIGSVAPFVGLFGTVWGIMNAFIGISKTQTTNLAVVAPGIAEALLATAIGLVAAIPAVVIYNVFARSITGYRQLLADAAAGVERLVSRDLDFRKVPPGNKKPSVSLIAGE